ncbi:hypothetical protein K488DRAFT_87203 [Vararia minispora EC-137]|uniref:Uncharacterized protein n=1 Tax=Vararia minispora EC-137 TaxID=1314806 RepID=A0ACB8QH63_9AGAM|nr:hypothetical protein K488DRAFT_87203 [Vararia minispora EC-137]
MSRLPQPSSSRTPSKTSTATSSTSTPIRARTTSTVRPPAASPSTTRSPTISRLAPPSPSPSARRTPSPTKPPTSSIPSRVRTKSTPKPPPQTVPVSEPDTPRLSIKEAIALKRAEAKKAQEAAAAAKKPTGFWEGLENASPDAYGKPEVEEEVGRWGVRETIERARVSGQINLSSRSLACLPVALFEIHLGVTPESLEGLADPPLPPPRHPPREVPWFEQRDLEALKAWNNEIGAIQPEISLFGSLKNIDLHTNKLTTLPATFADLSHLAYLDLSHNTLTTLPPNFFALPALERLDLSHNALTALPFGLPFAPGTAYERKDDYFAPAVVRADRPLPALKILNVAHNTIRADAVDADNLPSSLRELDLSENPLGDATSLLRALASARDLERLRIARAQVPESTFSGPLLDNAPGAPFANLNLLDLEETVPGTLANSIKRALGCVPRTLVVGPPAARDSGHGKEASGHGSVDGGNAGELRIVVGKKDRREAWELEADRHAQMRRMRSRGALRDDAAPASPPPPSPAPAPARRSVLASKPEPKPASAPAPVMKEQWEIEAEQGLLTEGGRRRARALAAAAASTSASASTFTLFPTPSSTSSAQAIASKYYDGHARRLALPPALPPPASGHGRTLSLHTAARTAEDISLPLATLPLALIAAQAFAADLRVLELRNRRADVRFILGAPDVTMPRLEVLILEACGLTDDVPVSITSEPTRSTERTLEAIARIFHGLRELDLSYNSLSASSLSDAAWRALALSDTAHGRPGLRALRLRGNRLEALGALEGLAQTLFGPDAGPEEGRDRWTLDELDLRENALPTLPPPVGLLPLDVLLVEGNVFRVPARRVWEREGTKGLLGWLRARVEG